MQDSLELQQPSVELLWQRVVADPDFESYWTAFLRPFVEHLPTLLADLLPMSFQAEVLAEAQRRYTQYCIENQYPLLVLQALGRTAENSPLFLAELNSYLETTLQLLSGGDITKMDDPDLKPELAEIIQLNTELQAGYFNNSLTVLEALTAQPGLFIAMDY